MYVTYGPHLRTRSTSWTKRSVARQAAIYLSSHHHDGLWYSSVSVSDILGGFRCLVNLRHMHPHGIRLRFLHLLPCLLIEIARRDTALCCNMHCADIPNVSKVRSHTAECLLRNTRCRQPFGHQLSLTAPAGRLYRRRAGNSRAACRQW